MISEARLFHKYMCRLWFILMIFALQLNCNQTNLGTESTRRLCSDDFNRSDSDSLGEYWEIGGGSFNPLPGKLAVYGQKIYELVRFNSFAYAMCTNKVEHNKTVSSLKFEPISANLLNGLFMLVMRSKSVSTLNDGLFCGIEAGAAAGNLTLFRGEQGVRTTLAQSPNSHAFQRGNSYILTFSVKDDKLVCSLSGTISDEITASDKVLRGGYSGFFIRGVSSDIEANIDDFYTEIIQ